MLQKALYPERDNNSVTGTLLTEIVGVTAPNGVFFKVSCAVDRIKGCYVGCSV